MNINPKLDNEIVPGRIYEDDDAAASSDKKRTTSFAQIVSQIVKMAAKDKVTQPSQNEGERVIKRKHGPETPPVIEEDSSKTNQENTSQLMKRVLDKLDRKDERSRPSVSS